MYNSYTDDVCHDTGIVPITCEELFKGIEAKKGTGAEYQVVLNMLEIYNEQVQNVITTGLLIIIKYWKIYYVLDA